MFAAEDNIIKTRSPVFKKKLIINERIMFTCFIENECGIMQLTIAIWN